MPTSLCVVKTTNCKIIFLKIKLPCIPPQCQHKLLYQIDHSVIYCREDNLMLRITRKNSGYFYENFLFNRQTVSDALEVV
jgi:hypothetical protein